MIIQFVKNGPFLAPMDDDGLSAMAKISQGEVVTVELTRPRNPRWHNMYWHLCGLLLDNSPEGQYGPTKTAVSDALKQMVGHVGVDGEPRSISFESMEQGEFEAFYSRVSDVVAGLLSTTPDEVREQIEALTGQRLG